MISSCSSPALPQFLLPWVTHLPSGSECCWLKDEMETQQQLCEIYLPQINKIAVSKD